MSSLLCHPLPPSSLPVMFIGYMVQQSHPSAPRYPALFLLLLCTFLEGHSGKISWLSIPPQSPVGVFDQIFVFQRMLLRGINTRSSTRSSGGHHQHGTGAGHRQNPLRVFSESLW